MKTLVWNYVDALRLVVLVQGTEPPSDEEWDAYAGKLRELYPQGGVKRVLVFSEGAAPNAAQRQKLHYSGEYVHRTAVITHSFVARQVVTAFGWFQATRAFSPAKLAEAFEYLDIPAASRLDVQKMIVNLRLRLSDPAAGTLPFELTDTISKLDGLVIDRLPRLRERLMDARSERSRPTMRPSVGQS